MKKKKPILRRIVLVIFILVTASFLSLNRHMTVHIVAQTKETSNPISLKIDGELLFFGEITSGLYFGQKVVAKNIGYGPHTINITHSGSKITYEKTKFFWFRRTLIITYWDDSLDTPHFDVWSKRGSFLPD